MGEVFLHNLALQLRADIYAPGDMIIRKGETGREMFIISRGTIEVIDDSGKVLNTLSDGAFFGELSLISAQPRTASIRAATPCDMFILDKKTFDQAIKNNPEFLEKIKTVAKERYK